jgi:hypothetical protein
MYILFVCTKEEMLYKLVYMLIQIMRLEDYKVVIRCHSVLLSDASLRKQNYEYVHFKAHCPQTIYTIINSEVFSEHSLRVEHGRSTLCHGVISYNAYKVNESSFLSFDRSFLPIVMLNVSFILTRT